MVGKLSAKLLNSRYLYRTIAIRGTTLNKGLLKCLKRLIRNPICLRNLMSYSLDMTATHRLVKTISFLAPV